MYFRGYNEEDRGKYVGCYLQSGAKGSAAEDRHVFAKQILMDFGKSSNTSKRKVISHCNQLDDTRNYKDGALQGTPRFAPSSAFSGKNTVSIGAMFYFKSSDNV